MKVPTLDLEQQYQKLKPEIDRAIQEILDSSSFILGEAVEDFEQNFATYCDTEHAIGVNSGTSALNLIYTALDFGRGDEVITSPFTFIATAEPLIHVGATPVFAEIDPETYTLKPDAVEAKITDSTKAIVAVHLYGQPAPMDQLRELADSHDLYLIEDAAQAHGAKWNGNRVGSLGDAAAFSFYPGKNLGAYGDAGAVTTNDEELADRIEKLRDHGRNDKYGHVEVGFNERMDGFQGAVLNVKLNHLDEWNQARRENASEYTEALSNDSEISTPTVAPEAEHVFHQYVIEVSRRDEVLEHLNNADIGASIHYPKPLHLQKSLQSLGFREGDFPTSESASKRVLSLPIFADLTEDQKQYVIDTTREAVRETSSTATV